MSRETQLDTHEIDKLLADDDFIDDFNFDEEEEIDFVSEEVDELAPEPESEPLPVVEARPEKPKIPADEPLSSAKVSPAGLVMSENIMAEVADEFESLDLSGLIGHIHRPRGIRMWALLALLVLLLQVVVIFVLARRPVLIRGDIQVLTPEIDLAAAPPPPPLPAEAPAAVDGESPPPYDPQVMMFTLFAPLYSLQGLKVVSLEIEVIQFPPYLLLQPVEEENLKIILGRRLRGLTEGEMLEKIKDPAALLEAPLQQEIEDFFAGRESEPARLEIRFPAIQVQE